MYSCRYLEESIEQDYIIWNTELSCLFLHIKKEEEKKLHPKNTKLGLLLFHTSTHCSRQPQPQNPSRMRRRNHAVVPQARRRESRLRFTVNACFEFRIRGAADGFHDCGELLGAHYADFGVGPHEHQSGGVGAATDILSLDRYLVE